MMSGRVAAPGALAWRDAAQGLAVGAGLGTLLALALWHEALTEVWDGRHNLAGPQAPSPAVAEAPPPARAVAAPEGPGLAEGDAAWLWLRERLQAQGLQVLALQTEPVQSGPLLASQLAQLRVLGTWGDWLAFCTQWADQAPWWAWEQWRLQAAGAAADQVQLEARLRLWLRPDPAPGADWAPLPVPLAAVASVPVGLWARPEAPAPAQGTAPSLTAASSPETHWWGVWTQAGQSQRVQGRGLEWTLRTPARAGATP